MKPQLRLTFQERSNSVVDTLTSAKLDPIIAIVNERIFRCYSPSAKMDFYLSLSDVNQLLHHDLVRKWCTPDEENFLPAASGPAVTELRFVRNYDAKNAEDAYVRAFITISIAPIELETVNEFIETYIHKIPLPFCLSADDGTTITDPMQLATISSESLVENVFINEFKTEFSKLAAAVKRTLNGNCPHSALFNDEDIRLELYKKCLIAAVKDYTKWRYIVLPDMLRAAYQIQCLVDAPELLVLTSLPKFSPSLLHKRTNTELLLAMNVHYQELEKSEVDFIRVRQLWGLLYNYARIESVDSCLEAEQSPQCPRASNFINPSAYKGHDYNTLGMPISESLVVNREFEISKPKIDELLCACETRFDIWRAHRNTVAQFNTPFKYEQFCGVAWFVERISQYLDDRDCYLKFCGSNKTRVRKLHEIDGNEDEETIMEEGTKRKYRHLLFGPNSISRAGLLMALFLIDCDATAKRLITRGPKFSWLELRRPLQQRFETCNFLFTQSSSAKATAVKQWLLTMTNIKEKTLKKCMQ